MFPETYKISGTTYNIQYASGSNNYAYWNYKVSGTNNNDWATAGLQYWLNTTEDETAEEPNKGYLSYLKGDTLSMIEETKYYLGTITYDTKSYSGIIDTPKEAYANERDVESCIDNIGNSESESGCKVFLGNQATWTGKIALMYPSDYGFSTESSNWETQLKDFDRRNFNAWMNSMPSYENWLLSPSSYNTSNVALWSTFSGNLNSNYVNSYKAVRPTLYLTSNVKITSGDGTSEQPYFLEI